MLIHQPCVPYSRASASHEGPDTACVPASGFGGTIPSAVAAELERGDVSALLLASWNTLPLSLGRHPAGRCWEVPSANSTRPWSPRSQPEPQAKVQGHGGRGDPALLVVTGLLPTVVWATQSHWAVPEHTHLPSWAAPRWHLPMDLPTPTPEALHR